MRGGTPEGITSQIFAIGGGDLVTRETYEFDQLIVAASGRARPWTLCITAASSDSPDACNAFGNIYGDSLRCRTDYLRVIKGEPHGDDYQRKISRNEIFYFSDGDLSTLMENLSQYDILDELRKAYRRGAVFCGVGAGAAALGKIGFVNDGKLCDAIGVVDLGIGTVAEGKSMLVTEAESKFGKQDCPGFVLDYMTALHVKESAYRIITPSSKGVAYSVVNGSAQEIASSLEFADLEALTVSSGSKVKQKA